MKKWMLVLLILPVFAEAQSKRKLRIAAEKENILTESNLQKHVQYLADDKLEGRRTGTAGELLAMEYIIGQYKSLGIEPKGSNGFVQEFEINEGLQLDEKNGCKINGQSLVLQDDYFPLAFSARKSAQGKPALALSEPGQPWFKDLKELLEENSFVSIHTLHELEASHSGFVRMTITLIVSFHSYASRIGSKLCLN